MCKKKSKMKKDLKTETDEPFEKIKIARWTK
jgi:hypothetical protein